MALPKVSIIMGSQSDLEVVKKSIQILKELGIEREVRILSAHRTPMQVKEYAVGAEERGIEVIIAAAGKAAHLPGVIASYTTLPIIGLPIQSSTLDGLDSLLSMVQMPKGIPVATVAINGSENAALLAAEILSIKYPNIQSALQKYRRTMQQEVLKQDQMIQKEEF
ncbi:5-(carboxyamino)imidazole ribonucleotide mutase [Garciella nitratireducens]|uniref:N5-carboxyaminoimidazole ribonucleotide mutase n=1 Tax=Garciella nitratireducens DSM 15102 TaxID=1121911 RepID=A0A1T4NDW3_9FIRM|nr:5-(carboxyamino)imidazole ribonucleotide mutase [Garciella nitratireducens]RBP44090.1 5-(carboxyamino)imidazole ribonucleotide mutase [Garciella nitratireducens]SJZ77177.1 5-(carboxyamino)imidazole ribonucleotide mutase [Garciella nitratireducens DSM 15102]